MMMDTPHLWSRAPVRSRSPAPPKQKKQKPKQKESEAFPSEQSERRPDMFLLRRRTKSEPEQSKRKMGLRRLPPPLPPILPDRLTSIPRVMEVVARAPTLSGGSPEDILDTSTPTPGSPLTPLSPCPATPQSATSFSSSSSTTPTTSTPNLITSKGDQSFPSSQYTTNPYEFLLDWHDWGFPSKSISGESCSQSKVYACPLPDTSPTVTLIDLPTPGDHRDMRDMNSLEHTTFGSAYHPGYTRVPPPTPMSSTPVPSRPVTPVTPGRRDTHRRHERHPALTMTDSHARTPSRDSKAVEEGSPASSIFKAFAMDVPLVLRKHTKQLSSTSSISSFQHMPIPFDPFCAPPPPSAAMTRSVALRHPPAGAGNSTSPTHAARRPRSFSAAAALAMTAAAAGVGAAPLAALGERHGSGSGSVPIDANDHQMGHSSRPSCTTPTPTSTSIATYPPLPTTIPPLGREERLLDLSDYPLSPTESGFGTEEELTPITEAAQVAVRRRTSSVPKAASYLLPITSSTSLPGRSGPDSHRRSRSVGGERLDFSLSPARRIRSASRASVLDQPHVPSSMSMTVPASHPLDTSVATIGRSYPPPPKRAPPPPPIIVPSSQRPFTARSPPYLASSTPPPQKPPPMRPLPPLPPLAASVARAPPSRPIPAGISPVSPFTVQSPTHSSSSTPMPHALEPDVNLDELASDQLIDFSDPFGGPASLPRDDFAHHFAMAEVPPRPRKSSLSLSKSMPPSHPLPPTPPPVRRRTASERASVRLEALAAIREAEEWEWPIPPPMSYRDRPRRPSPAKLMSYSPTPASGHQTPLELFWGKPLPERRDSESSTDHSAPLSLSDEPMTRGSSGHSELGPMTPEDFDILVNPFDSHDPSNAHHHLPHQHHIHTLAQAPVVPKPAVPSRPPARFGVPF